MEHVRSFNPESKFIPVDFQVARLLDYDKMKADGGKWNSWETQLVCDQQSPYYSDVEQCFFQSGSSADGIWNLIDLYDDRFTDEEIVIEEVENPNFTEAQVLGAKAFFMAFLFFLGEADNFSTARKKVKEIYSQPHLDVSKDDIDQDADTINLYDWYK